MNKRFSENFFLFSILMDVVWIVFCISFLKALRPALSLLPFAAIIPPPYNLPWVIYLLFPIAWVGTFLLLSVYDNSYSIKFSEQLVKITSGSIFSALLLAGVLYLTYRDVSRLFFITLILMGYLGMLSWRLVARRFLIWLYQEPEFHRRILVIGSGKIIRKMTEEFGKQHQSGYSLIGVIDDTNSVYKEPDEVDRGDFDLVQRILDNKITDIILGLTIDDRSNLVDLLGILHRLPVRVWIIPDYFQLTIQKAVIEDFAGIPMVDLKAPTLDNNQRIIKRAFDLSLTIILLPLSMLLMLIISIAIRYESQGPVIYRSQRIGENGKIFEMLKFRTMVIDADSQHSNIIKEVETGIIIHKFFDDPRVTKVGRFLRRSSLDEIPQIINVLKGDMSLVGPRPELPYLVEKYELWQRQRFSVPQGITGWWQINGRSNKPMHLHTEDDLYYIQNYSLWLDIYILLKTIGVVISGKGAF
jgi:exopolysaccharide biosynthesis polyprenyl glycosylphosphotransferase